MNEKKKVWIVLAVVAVIGILLVASLITNGSKQEKILEQFNTTMASTKEQIVYLGRPTCGYCTLTKPVLDELAEEYEFDYLYINIDELSDRNVNKILKALDVDGESFGTPYIAVVKDNKVVDTQPGYAPEEKLFTFFQKNKVIATDKTLTLNYLTYAEYQSIITAGQKTLVVAVSPTDSSSQNALLGLKEISKANGLKINILNLNTLTSEEYTSFTKSLPYIASLSQITTPLSLIIEHGDAVAYKLQYTSVNDYKTFLTDNGILNK